MAWEVSLLNGELVVARLSWDIAESKLPGLDDKAADTDR
jgi:hypothetical protein